MNLKKAVEYCISQFFFLRICFKKEGDTQIQGSGQNKVKLSMKKHPYFHDFSLVLLLRQVWIINYYGKCSSDNLSIEIKNTDVSRESCQYFKNSSFQHFNFCFVLKHLFQITEKRKHELKINNYLTEQKDSTIVYKKASLFS